MALFYTLYIWAVKDLWDLKLNRCHELHVPFPLQKSIFTPDLLLGNY